LSKPILKDPRIRRNESIPEVYIVPKTSGANALVVRDYADTEDRLVLTENREIHFKIPMIRQHPKVDSRLQIIRKTEPYDGLHLELGWLYPNAIQSGPSSMIFQTRGSLSTDTVMFRSFDGSAYVRCARLIGGYLEIEKGKLTDHLIIPASYNILGRSFSGTAKIVTETTMTLKDSALPTSPKNVLFPQNVYVTADNPTGSGVTLYVSVRLAHSDDTETTIENFTVPAGGTAYKDYSPVYLAPRYKDGVSIVGVRLYAYVSATPPAGYEPAVTLTRVTGFQF